MKEQDHCSGKMSKGCSLKELKPNQNSSESFYTSVSKEDETKENVGEDIFQLISDGNITAVQNIIMKNSDCLSKLDKLNATPLHYAAGDGNLEIMQMIMDDAEYEVLNVMDCNGNTPLHWATEKNQIESVKMLLDRGANPNILNSAVESPLHLAIKLSHNEMVEVLLSYHNTDVNLGGELENTPLILACWIDNHGAVRILFDHGALLCKPNRFKIYAIHVAAFAGSKTSMELLLTKGEELGYTREKQINFIDKSLNSPLHLAIHGGNIETIKCCIDNGANLELQENNKSMALHLACSQGAIETVKLILLSYSGKKDLVNIPDGIMQTPLHRAAVFDHYEVVDYLLSKGANIDSVDCELRSALLLATSCGAWKTVNLLVSKGVNTKLKDKSGCNFLHLVALQPRGLKNLNEEVLQVQHCSNCIKELLNDVDNDGCTPLHYACKQGVSDSVNNMIGLKVCVLSKTKNKRSALHFAAAYGRFHTCRNLLQNMSDTRLLNEGDEKGMTPLHMAAENGHAKVVQLLLKKGALTLCDFKEYTSLHYAALGGYTQTMQVLLDTHLKLMDETEEEGNTALHLAAREGHTSAVCLLLAKGAKITLNKSNASFLHEAVHHGRKDVTHAIIFSERWHEAIMSFDFTSDNGCSLLDMIAYLPEAYRWVLDRSMNESSEDKRSPNFFIEYDFRYLQVPLYMKEMTKENKALHFEPLICMNNMVRFKRMELLTHPVCREYLRMKWIAYGIKAHVINLAVYLLGLLPLTALIVYPREKNNSTETFSPKYAQRNGQVPHFVTVCMFIVLFMSLFGVCKELVQLFQQRWKYLMDCSNLLDWSIIVFNILFVVPMLFGNFNGCHWEFGSIAVFLSWVNLLLYFQRFEQCGIYVVMFWEILKTLFRIVLLFFFLILAFGLTFYALMNSQVSYSSPVFSTIRVFTMMLGEINYQDSFLIPLMENKMAYPGLTFIMLIVFVLLMPILLMNLLIGLAVGDIAEVQRNASLKRIAMQIQLHTSLENKLPLWFLKRVDQLTLKVYPNRSRFCGLGVMYSFFFFLNVVQSTSLTSDVSVLELELKKQKYRLKDMSALLHKQHELIKLIIQKMEIVSETEDQDDQDLSQYSKAKRHNFAQKTSKWDTVLKVIQTKGI
nr:PREDICTED: transient receptor potential cation channel subfamily A member 1 [Latimeria chalumnae]|eukprot:XP_014342061.1 PREDICTED: transient receptor potential cation channel subfamily A member 1 [Latimeria chalumnae]